MSNREKCFRSFAFSTAPNSVSAGPIPRDCTSMKKPALLLAPLVLAATLASTGCYGSFSAWHALHKWNGTVTTQKVPNSLIHFALWVIPVYELVITADLLIFNTIEFITDKPVFKE